MSEVTVCTSNEMRKEKVNLVINEMMAEVKKIESRSIAKENADYIDVEETDK